MAAKNHSVSSPSVEDDISMSYFYNVTQETASNVSSMFIVLMLCAILILKFIKLILKWRKQKMPTNDIITTTNRLLTEVVDRMQERQKSSS